MPGIGHAIYPHSSEAMAELFNEPQTMSIADWRRLGWEHPVWELVRYFLSIGTKVERGSFAKALRDESSAKIGKVMLKLEPDVSRLLSAYLDFRSGLWNTRGKMLRTEPEANAFCVKAFKESPKTTHTKNQDHHQSSKAMVLTTTRLAEAVCKKHGFTIDPNPQTRCVWLVEHKLHVTARNLDGAVPALLDPILIWEIKEYWGTTSGGSKMSDAVYECALVGRELRDFEKRTGLHVDHAVLLDGKDQWTSRKSDLLRFCDLYYQGLIDALIIGREIETHWQPYVKSVIEKARGIHPTGGRPDRRR
ncbi:MAG: hypothetical protein ABSG25_10920 [Bryobacteraceae bacterium]